ncbi:MAG: asparagine synthase (glutamine-hydrolyzing) [Deltaproteobacteria bacterium]
MCGIHGIVSLNGDHLPEPEQLARMGEVTTHRGPDDAGAYCDGPVGIAMRRLSIIDLAGGHQPISNADKTLWIVCNGEIYNFRELRKELEGRGHVFATNSDSEAALHAYAEWGDKFVTRLEGMFGLAIYDKKQRRVVIARDRIGIKPIYYHQTAERIVFASEAKAILEVPGINAGIDPIGLHTYLSLGYVAAPYSLLDGIRKLPVASTMTIDLKSKAVSIDRYWRIDDRTDDHKSESQWVDALLTTLEKSIVSQMVSDVPLGAFLSGGIDSSSIVGFMSRHSDRPVKTYAIGFDTGSAGSYYNELPFARQVAERFRTDHKEIVVRPDVVELLPRLLWHMDEPIADSAFITTYLVAEFARKDVTVILSGVGGDELFGGYRRYLGEFYGQYYQLVPKRLRQRVVAPIARRMPADRHSPLLNVSRLARSFLLSNELPFEERYKSYVGVYAPEQIDRLARAEGEAYDAIGAAFADTSSNPDAVRRMFEVDLATQMPDDLLLLTDKMTMATSLECRVPFLDTELVELSASMPSRFKIRGRELKYILKKALGDLLPHEILYRKKRGFGAPMGAWIKHELAGLTGHLLSREAVERRGLFDPAIVEETLALHAANKADHTDHILALLFLEVWCRLYLDRQSFTDLSAQIRSEVKA